MKRIFDPMRECSNRIYGSLQRIAAMIKTIQIFISKLFIMIEISKILLMLLEVRV